MFSGLVVAAASAARTDPPASTFLGLGLDGWAQLALAGGTIVLAIVTYLSVRELKAQRRDAAKPHLVIVTHKEDVSFGMGRSWTMSDGFEVSNFGSGYAYEAAVMAHLRIDGGAKGDKLVVRVAWIASIAPGQTLVLDGVELAAPAIARKDDPRDAVYTAYCRDSFGHWYRFEGTGAVPHGRDPRTFRSGQRVKRVDAWVRTGDVGPVRDPAKPSADG
jgi:hypothetical protein